jgi:hypothetical protein
MKTAILILSDPKSGSEEANGRLFNALAIAHDLRERKQEVTVIFQGAGTRWPAQLTQKDHPFHDLFASVRHSVAGASKACAVVFGATEGCEASETTLLDDNQLPGTPGLPSVVVLIEQGYTPLVF